MKKLLMLLSLVLLFGCSTNSLSVKEKNNTAKLEVVGKVAYQQGMVLNEKKPDIQLAKEYNKNIADLVGNPKDKKETNFIADIQNVKKGEYVANAGVEQDLVNTKNQLVQYKKWFGLEGVYLSLKQFSCWAIGSTLALTVLVVLMRIFASSSPIIASIWGVISNILAWFIRRVGGWIPGLLDNLQDTEKDVVSFWGKCIGWITSLFTNKNVKPTEPVK